MSIVDNGDLKNMINIIKKKGKVNVEKETESFENENVLFKIMQWITELKNPNLRENALVELSKKRESFPHLADYLYFSTGTIAIL